MTNPRRPRGRRPLTALGAAAAIALALCLSACATGASGAAASTSTIDEYAQAAGIQPDLVYTTEIDGYDLAPQSVGAGAAEGMTATWFNQSTAAMVTIRTDTGEMTANSCAQTPVWDASDEVVSCTDEGDGIWRRVAGTTQEYMATRDGATIRVTGDNGAPASDLLAAAKALHVPSEAELDLLFSDLPDAPATPVVRGDLPENGDGAPIDPTGPGG